MNIDDMLKMFVAGECCVQISDEEEKREFLDMCGDIGLRWCDGKHPQSGRFYENRLEMDNTVIYNRPCAGGLTYGTADKHDENNRIRDDYPMLVYFCDIFNQEECDMNNNDIDEEGLINILLL